MHLILGVLLFALCFWGWYLYGKKMDAKKDQEEGKVDSIISTLLYQACQGCEVISMFDPDPEKRKRAADDRKLILFKKYSKLSLERISELAQVWEKATEEQKKRIWEWGELVT
jgi:hypothetical protein